jgi:hypothetical protein
LAAKSPTAFVITIEPDKKDREVPALYEGNRTGQELLGRENVKVIDAFTDPLTMNIILP